MSIRHEYYKNCVDRRTRVRRLIFFFILLVAFLVVFLDSLHKSIPFYYISFLFLGRLMSLIFIKTMKVELREQDNRFAVKWNVVDLLVIIAVIVLRLFFFPRILAEFNVPHISDAMLLILVGWFMGRITTLSDKVEEGVFLAYIHQKGGNEQATSDSLVSDVLS
jgi:hypothetical protein